MVSAPQVGQIIRLRSWHGVVLDVFTNEAGKTILRVQTVRNVFRRLNPEFIEFDLAPDAIEPASLDDLQAEVANYEAVLEQSLQELVSHARMNGDSL
ncbi:MAG: hypothetical protein WA040_17865 [Anaerolineae bacterium]